MIVARHAARGARANARAAFTLMEVMVGAAILCILAGVGSIALFRYIDDARESTAKVQITTIEKALVAFKTTHGDYPPNLDALLVREGGKDAYLEEKDIV